MPQALKLRPEVPVLRWFLNRRLDAAEKSLGVSVDYARYILRVSPRALFKLARFIPVAEYRRKLPAEPFYAARIVATRHDDCGECVQIAVNQAKLAGVSPQLLQAVLDRRLDDLPEGVADACRFAVAVVTAGGQADAVRDSLRRRFGDEALIELALTIASSRLFPAVKRALGYSESCSLTTISV